MKIYDSVVAIDGPAGSGKSSVAKLLAQKISGTYIDTGAMYRALAIGLSELDIDFSKSELSPAETQKVSDALDNIQFEYAVNEKILVQIKGRDLTSEIREHYVSALASTVSKFTVVRDFLGAFQRELPKNRLCVMEGRDIGTVIFPNAFLKIFLTATPETRAKRRYDQLLEKGEKVDLDSLVADIIARDKIDSTRSAAPLKQASDAIAVDTSESNLEQVVEKLTVLFHENKERM